MPKVIGMDTLRTAANGEIIETGGEMILRIVIRENGKLATLFPVNSFLKIGAGVIAVSVFTENAVEAAEQVDKVCKDFEEDPFDWGQFLVEVALDILIIGMFVTPDNEGGDEALRYKLVEITGQAATNTIKEIEDRENITLTEDQRIEIHKTMKESIGLKWYGLNRHLVKDTFTVALGGEQWEIKENHIQNNLKLMLSS